MKNLYIGFGIIAVEVLESADSEVIIFSEIITTSKYLLSQITVFRVKNYKSKITIICYIVDEGYIRFHFI